MPDQQLIQQLRALRPDISHLLRPGKPDFSSRMETWPFIDPRICQSGSHNKAMTAEDIDSDDNELNELEEDPGLWEDDQDDAAWCEELATL